MMMKSDVMDDFEEIKVATAYNYKNEQIDYLPFDACTQTMTPVLESFKGWNQKIEKEIPQQLNEYIEFIEKYVGVPITLVSYGPDRTECIERNWQLIVNNLQLTMYNELLVDSLTCRLIDL